jgi:uncharacterized protein YndB with AHSA1/START domain
MDCRYGFDLDPQPCRQRSISCPRVSRRHRRARTSPIGRAIAQTILPDRACPTGCLARRLADRARPHEAGLCGQVSHASPANVCSTRAMDHPSVKVSMLIRRPPGDVFAAFVNPQTLREFWLADASDPLAPGARVQWQFMVPGATEQVSVTHFEAPRHLAFDWSDGIHVEMTFEPFGDGATRAGIALRGFDGADALVQATSAVEGFTIVLCDLKTLLETGASAHLVRDKAALIIAAKAADGG